MHLQVLLASESKFTLLELVNHKIVVVIIVVVFFIVIWVFKFFFEQGPKHGFRNQGSLHSVLVVEASLWYHAECFIFGCSLSIAFGFNVVLLEFYIKQVRFEYFPVKDIGVPLSIRKAARALVHNFDRAANVRSLPNWMLVPRLLVRGENAVGVASSRDFIPAGQKVDQHKAVGYRVDRTVKIDCRSQVPFHAGKTTEGFYPNLLNSSIHSLLEAITYPTS